MNQSMRNSGGMSAARHRSGRVFRRSLTPTLALLAAMALGLVIPAPAAAQTAPNLAISGGGGGGGGGAQAEDTDGGIAPESNAGGAGGYGNVVGSGPGKLGTTGTESDPGIGGSGGAGVVWIGPDQQSGGGGDIIAEGGNGGNGYSASFTDTISRTYEDMTLNAGSGGEGGEARAADVALPGSGGGGGNAQYYGAAGITTTVYGDITLNTGAHGNVGGGGAGGAGGVAGDIDFIHQGTVSFSSLFPTHAINITRDGGALDVRINTLQINATDVTLGITNNAIYSNDMAVAFENLALTNGGSLIAGTAATQWGIRTGFQFNNLIVSGSNNLVDLAATSNLAYRPGYVGGNLTFLLPQNIASLTGPMVTFDTINGGAAGLNLDRFNPNNLEIITAGTGYYEGMAINDRVQLIDGMADPNNLYVDAKRMTLHKGGLRFEDFYLQRDGNAANSDLWLTYGGAAQAVGTGQVFTPYFQGQMAAMHIVSGASRPILDESIRALANTTTNVGVPLINLSAIGSSTKLNTGSDAKLESFGGLLSVGAKMGNNSGVSTVAAFGEFGTGSYDTFTEITDLRSFNGGRFIGSGDADYAGGGVFVHHLFDATRFAGGLSVEGSFRLGTVKNQFNMDMLDRSGYDISRRYWGGHVGAGYNMPLNNLNSVDFFGQLHLTNVESGDFRSTANEAITFDSAQSTVSRIGGRYNHNINELFKAYATAAWEYEFDGETGGSVDGIKIQDPASIKGSSGFGQLGMNVKSANNPVSLDLSVFGVIGQQEGYGGTVGLKLDF